MEEAGRRFWASGWAEGMGPGLSCFHLAGQTGLGEPSREAETKRGMQRQVNGELKTQLSDFSFTFHFHALEKEMATHSSVLAWRIPGTGEPGGLLSMGCQCRPT